MSLLKVSGITKYKEGETVLKDISFNVARHQKTAIAGATGSGKTTLLKIIAGLIQADAGAVLFENTRVAGPDEKLVPGHPSIGYLSQHFELPNNYRVEEIFEYANTLSPQAAGALFDVCRVSHLLKRRTDQLSGGEKQRIAIARLLIGSPSLLLLDEPFSNLDLFHRQVMKSVIHDIGDQLDITCMLVSHDPQDVLPWADQVIILKEAVIHQQGTPSEIYQEPVDEHAAALFGSYNIIPASLADGKKSVNGKQVILRPENIRISRTIKTKLKGRVSRQLFFGGFYEIEVALDNAMLSVRTNDGGFFPGEEVYVAFDQDASAR